MIKLKKIIESSGYYDPEFGGSENFYKAGFGKMLYTDSVKYFSEKKKSYWVIDVVNSYFPKLSRYDFVVLTFDVKGSSCRFEAREDTGSPVIVKQNITYTDLDQSVKMYLSNGVLMFPSDY